MDRMTDDLKDEPMLPERLLEAARAHHAPPPPPREALWRGIAVARRPRVRALPVRRRLWYPVGVAAALVAGLAIGLGVRPRARVVPTVVARAGNDSAAAPVDLLAQAAARQTIGQAEVLLTQFRADAVTGAAPVTTPEDARRLLEATRLLLGSPSIRDPRLRDLLEDLELVLSQVAEGPTAQEDRAVITDGLDRRDVLPRLRAALPAPGVVPQPGAL
jgi:hypothetical protein